MSLMKLLFEDYSPTINHSFGTGYTPHNIWKNYDKILHIGENGFEVSLDVSHFQPNEITVKSDNHLIVVHAKHDEKPDDHGHISREFTRRYDLPSGFKTEDVTSYFSADGILTIKCPKPEGSNFRHIPIQQTGPVKQSIKTTEEKGEQT